MPGHPSRTQPNEGRPLLFTPIQSGDLLSFFYRLSKLKNAKLEDLIGPCYDRLDISLQFGGTEARKKLEKSLLKKLDFRLSILLVIYILNYIDRNNAAAARLKGFEEDLGLEGSQFASIISVLYVGYILMQAPSNMFLSQIGKPSIYLPCCMMIWGAVSFLTGFTTTYRGALLARFVLGFVEAPFFPGALYLIARWYKRTELSQRTAFLACGILISNAFGSLIASGIFGMMEGVFEYAAWRWLFFIEGGVTVLVAAIALFILPDFPETENISWLTPAEQALAKWRMVEDNGGISVTIKAVESPSKGAMDGLTLALSDWKVLYLAITLFFLCLSMSFHLYFPTLAATMGYDPIITLLLCAPPWIVAAAWALWFSRHSDRSDDRCLHIVSSLVIGITGFLLSISTMNIAVRYFSLFLMAQMYAGFICFLAWASFTVSNPPSKRAVALAIINAISQTGNITGAYVWAAEWAPTYNKSYLICIASAVACGSMCLWLKNMLKKMNENMDQEDERNIEITERNRTPWRYQI